MMAIKATTMNNAPPAFITRNGTAMAAMMSTRLIT